MKPTLPEALRRLVPDLPPEDASTLEKNEEYLLGRLLEDGDGRDLGWLAAHVPEDRWAAWLEERGGRQLSRRSRAFWSLILGLVPAEAPAVAEELWPL